MVVPPWQISSVDEPFRAAQGLWDTLAVYRTQSDCHALEGSCLSLRLIEYYVSSSS